MAGTVAPTAPIIHRRRGVVRTTVALTTDAAGVVTAAAAGTGFGRLVGCIFSPGTLASNAVVTVLDSKIGATLLTLTPYLISQVRAAIFGNTTTGDTTGGTAEDLWTTGAAHGLVASDGVVFTAIAGNGAGGPTVGTTYYVVTGVTLAATTFTLSDTVAHAVAGTNIVNVGATDASSSSWYKVGSEHAALLRPAQNIVDNAGATVTAASTAPNVLRPIMLGGKVQVAVSGGGNAKSGTVVLIVDESGLGELALTV